MTLILLAVLAQAGAQEASIDARIAAFIRGDAGARDAVMKAGPSAIAPLRKAREKAPGKVDSLVFEIKKAAAWPRNPEAATAMQVSVKMSLQNATVDVALQYMAELGSVQFVNLTGGKPDLKSVACSIETADSFAWDILDGICRTAGVDYGFFHGVVVIATPEKLWGGRMGAAAMERQTLTEAEGTLKKQLTHIKLDFDFQNQRIGDMLDYLKEFCGVKIEVDEAVKGSMDLKFKGLRFFDALALMTQGMDCDYILQGDKFFVGTSEAIGKKIGDKK